MKKSGEEISPYEGEEDFTKITFLPEYKRFHMKELEEDMFQLFKKRTFDLSGVVNKKVSVRFNGKKIKIADFKDYCSYYMKGMTLKDSEEVKMAYISVDRWELMVGASQGDFHQVSFVNSICTIRGGTHVDYIVGKICEGLAEEAQRRMKKKIKIKNQFIKSSIFIILNCLIENPAFDSQTKETLITKASSFGSQIELTDKFFKDLMKTGVIDQIILQAQMKEEIKMQKQLKGVKKSRLFGINKLDDANKAGTKESLKCTLILTEGDSAKALAMSGLEVIGRDHFGVFPLRGKFLNVRDASTESILKNQEVSHIIEIMGLSVGKKYNGDLSSLRYGSIMIMADQDHDGSHIKGLIINFIHHFWPDLLRSNSFLKEFITPIIKASKGNIIHTFFTVNDFKVWAEQRVNEMKTWRVKYYKGLGTSDDKEAKEYFSNIEIHKINFRYDNGQDDEAVDLAFNKKKADDRKEWLSHFDPNIFVDHKIKVLRYYDFIHKELIQFSVANNQRAIPCLCDGLKVGQRKILFACFKRKLTKEIKVAQLSGYVAEHTEYHHGEQNLADTIIGMAQTFVGSNNINLLLPNGQFGTRSMGGKDAASARYLHTALNKVTRFIFLEADDHVLNYIEEDGKLVEPTFYMPIIPMVLVNGCDGIGTGWSTNIPNFCPRELAKNIRNRLNGVPFVKQDPHYKGYTGELTPKDEKSYNVKGRFDYYPESNMIDVKELPLQKWTSDYKKYLEEIIQDKSEVKNLQLEDLREYHTTRSVHFRLVLGSGQSELSEENLEKILKINSSLSLNNLVLFNNEGKILRYDSQLEIMENYYNLRLLYYGLRKEYLISRIDREIAILDNKSRFIQEVNDDLMVISKRNKENIIGQLVKRKYTPYSKLPQIKSSIENNLIAQINKKQEEAQAEAEAEEGEGQDIAKERQNRMMDEESDSAMNEYNYLVSMQILSLSTNLVEKMKREIENKKIEVRGLKEKDIKEMWFYDLDNFLIELDKAEKAEEIEIVKDDKKAKKPPKDEITKPRKKKRAQKDDSDDTDDDSVIASQIKKKNTRKSTTNIDEEEDEYKPPKPKTLKITGSKDGQIKRPVEIVKKSIIGASSSIFIKPKSTEQDLDKLIDSSTIKVFASDAISRERLRKVVSLNLDDFKKMDAAMMSLEEKMYYRELQDKQKGGGNKDVINNAKSSTLSNAYPANNLLSFFKQPMVDIDEDEESIFKIVQNRAKPKFREESPSN